MAAGGRGCPHARSHPYAIPVGASDHRLGALCFANWACEVRHTVLYAHLGGQPAINAYSALFR
jgi:1-aminocyclopropane-1-carboxylate deaminase/D-cysteine desulfhydrase-like pyridoxal-dependent ACC family enzyme